MDKLSRCALQAQIRAARERLRLRVRSLHDLMHPETLRLSQEVDELVVRYLRLEQERRENRAFARCAAGPEPLH